MKRLVSMLAAGVIAGGVLLSAQSVPAPRRAFGDSVTGAFEGWYYNADGSRAFLVGYYNRNSQQELDIPIGPNNHIEPGGPDMGQPTHFLPGRQWGMFAVQAPKDFKPTDSFVWTLTVNGATTSIPFRVLPDYVMSPFKEIAVGNTPPVVKFEPSDKGIQGPLASLSTAPTMTTTVAAPLPLNVWASDDAKYTSGTSAPPVPGRPAVTVRWSKYRGPGKVTFDKARPEVAKLPTGPAVFNGKASANATFSEAGDYVLHLTANDSSGDGGGGFGCCWTTSVVKVTVKP
ncbi:MAG TPA: hypothetical protein VGH34_07730 [Vicinamibacterales bacterium]